MRALFIRTAPAVFIVPLLAAPGAAQERRKWSSDAVGMTGLPAFLQSLFFAVVSVAMLLGVNSAKADTLLFYNAANGVGATAIIAAMATTRSSVPSPDFRSGHTSPEPPGGGVLFYNASTGEGATASVAAMATTGSSVPSLDFRRGVHI